VKAGEARYGDIVTVGKGKTRWHVASIHSQGDRPGRAETATIRTSTRLGFRTNYSIDVGRLNLVERDGKPVSA
jgi:hypothetical protein